MQGITGWLIIFGFFMLVIGVPTLFLMHLLDKQSPKSKTPEELLLEAKQFAELEEPPTPGVYDEQAALKVITRDAQRADPSISAETVRHLMQAVWHEINSPGNTLNPDELLHKHAKAQALTNEVTDAISDGEFIYLAQIGLVK